MTVRWKDRTLFVGPSTRQKISWNQTPLRVIDGYPGSIGIKDFILANEKLQASRILEITAFKYQLVKIQETDFIIRRLNA